MRRIVVPAIVTLPLVVLYVTDGIVDGIIETSEDLRLNAQSITRVVDAYIRIRTAVGWLRGWRKLRKRNRCKSHQQNARFPRHSAGARLPHFYCSSKQITADISLTILRSQYFTHETLTDGMQQSPAYIYCNCAERPSGTRYVTGNFFNRLSGNQGRDNMIDQ